MIDRQEAWASLMQSALAGDQAAYRRLLAELAPALRASVRRRLSAMGVSGEECEDIVQETLLAIHLKRHTWRTSEPFGPWLFTVARNKMIDHVRRRGRRIEVPIDDVADFLPAPRSAPVPIGRGRAASGRSCRRGSAPSSGRWRSRAPRWARRAERLKMTPGAVRVALHRGFASLAARLRKE